MDYEKTQTEQTTVLTIYETIPQAGQTLRCVVDESRGTMQITLTDETLGAYVWEGLLIAAPLIYDLLGHVIVDQASTLVPEEG